MGKRRVSVVFPCLNEEQTLGDCIDEARAGVEAIGAEPEIVVVDNGSSDDSTRIAEARGARVISERRRGYGSALGRGIREAAGDVVVFGDCDGSYRFDQLGPLVDAIDAGADLAMGSRLRGTIEPGAMPTLHRRLGTPVLTFLVNRLFGTRISDVNCGQRALSREAAQHLDLHAAGMEFASEMVIKAALAKMDIREVPVNFRRDKRDRAPHLNTWRDGWRHLRFILLFAPNLVLIAPGVALLLVGIALGGPAFLGAKGFGGAAGMSGAILILLGSQLVQVGLLVKTWYHVEGFYRRPYLDALFRYLHFELALVFGIGLIVVGVIVAVPLALAWRERIDVDPVRLAAAMTYLVLGIQIVGTAVILSVLGIRRRRTS